MGADENKYNLLGSKAIELRNAAQAAKQARSRGRVHIAKLLEDKTEKLKAELREARKTDFSKRQKR